MIFLLLLMHNGVDPGSTATPAGESIGLDEILSFVNFADSSMFTPNIPRGSNWSFAKEICHEQNHHSGSAMNRRALSRAYCGWEESANLTLLIYRISKYEGLRACQRFMKLDFRSRMSGKCAIWITFEHMVFQTIMSVSHVFKIVRNQLSLLPNADILESNIWGRSNDFETAMRIGRDLVESCQLRQAIQDNWFLDEMGYKMFAKLALLFARTVFSTSPPSNFANMCWEPELQEAERFYGAPGKWHVDEKCVSTLQKISVKILTYTLTVSLSPKLGEDRPELNNVIYFLLSLHDVPDIAEHILLFLKEYSDFFLQSFWYPPFKRFLRYAKQRSQDNSSIVSISCKGLQGSRNEVYNTILQLLRLVIVNELRYPTHSDAYILLGVIFNRLLPFIVHEVI